MSPMSDNTVSSPCPAPPLPCPCRPLTIPPPPDSTAPAPAPQDREMWKTWPYANKELGPFVITASFIYRPWNLYASAHFLCTETFYTEILYFIANVWFSWWKYLHNIFKRTVLFHIFLQYHITLFCTVAFTRNIKDR